jgi:hypothetical protein
MMGTDVQAVQPIIDRLRGEQRTITSIRPVRETLEDLFMRAVTDPRTGRILAPGAGPRSGRRPAESERGKEGGA